MGRWGMTMERFFNKFEEVIFSSHMTPKRILTLCSQNMHEGFRNLLGHHLLLPPTHELLEIFEQETRIWQGGPENTPKQGTEPTELGTEIMNACASSKYTAPQLLTPQVI